jgi:putative transcriptional regulator
VLNSAIEMSKKASKRNDPWHPLTGWILLADPSLQDGYFDRSVLVLTEHKQDKGAHGYIMNRPTGKRVGDLLSAKEFAPLAAVPVSHGGPVSQEHLTFAAFAFDRMTKELFSVTHLTVQDAVARQLAGEKVRAFVGYAGWEAGQLEEELEREAWVLCQPRESALRTLRPKQLWRDIMRTMGPYYRLLSGTPEDPSLN